jgi:hypothetical protein
MPSKKQRRRRAKERRHEYEYVYVDDEGHEVEIDPAEAPAAASKDPKKAAPAKAGSKKVGAKPAGGSVRPVPAPNWRRVLKRGAIFAPFMFLAIYLLGRKLSLQAKVIETLWLMILFIPFSYLIDRMMYRRYLRQTGQEPARTQRPARKPKEKEKEKEKAKASSRDD